MAGINTYIKLRDGMSAPLLKIANATEKASDKLNKFTGSTRAAGTAAQQSVGKFNMLGSVFAGSFLAAGAIAGARALGSAIASVGTSAEEFAGIQARLGLVANSQKEVAGLNQAIFESAQRARGSYFDMANAVSKLAINARDAFPDPAEVVGFTEGIQKLFAVGGASVAEQKSAMLQLTQALGSGRLQGDEFRSISENAPMLLNMISKELGVTRGEVKALAAEGKITSAVIKDSILKHMGDIDDAFAKVPKRWGDHFKKIGNMAVVSFAPVFGAITRLANSKSVQTIVDNVSTAVQRLAPVFLGAVTAATWFIDRTADGLNTINAAFNDHSVLVKGALTAVSMALGHVAGMMLVTAGRAGISAAALALHTVHTWAATAATIAQAYAQGGLNAALYACPITWIVGAVVGLVAVFYGAIAAVNHFAGTSVSATGLIFNVFSFMFAGIYNLLVTAWNKFIVFANFLGSVFVSPGWAIYNLFVDIWNGIVECVAGAINSIVGMTNSLFGTSWGTVSAPTFARKDIAGVVPFGRADYANPASWAASGYAAGKKFEDFLGSIGSPNGAFGTPPTDGARDIDNAIADNTAEGAKQGKRAADALDSTVSDLKYLRDAAEREAINRYVNATVKVDAGGLHVTSGGERNFDGMMRAFCENIAEALETGTEGVLQ